MNLLNDKAGKIGAGLGLVALISGMYVWGSMGKPDGGVKVERESAPVLGEKQQTVDAPKVVKIYVTGAVTRPGVYDLSTSDRVVDALKLAGGFADGADQSGVNLAAKLVDGMQVTVPWVGQEKGALDEQAGSKILVSVNSGTEADFQKLPHVGPILAGEIVRYRTEHGAFESIEDLAQVPGVGEKILDKIRDRLVL